MSTWPTVDAAVLGAPIKLDLKSLVWYQPDVFAAGGYAVPTTFAELVVLSDQMVANGDTPWCNWIGSGSATGWLGTDWVEDLLLGADGPVVYDEWVEHTVPFVDARVLAAFEKYGQMIDTAGYVFQRYLMLDLSFIENAGPLVSDECMMHRQATFFATFLQGFGGDLAEGRADGKTERSSMGVGRFQHMKIKCLRLFLYVEAYTLQKTIVNSPGHGASGT